jgi:repressor LexA
MHALQKELLEQVDTHDLGRMSLREIGELLGEKHPQKIKHHLAQLEQKGLIEFDRELRTLRRVRPEARSDDRLVSIPILGAANCGPATVFAQENIEGYLRISNKLIKPMVGLFALKALGRSMNKASIDGLNIEDGDYVIVNSDGRTARSRDYVLCVTGGLANIKRFIREEGTQQVILMSESTEESPPIVLHPDDIEFLICGVVIKVVKKPSMM